ncbi:MAG: DUF4982 domain-containing protein [Clostridia bacterium]|nr:DUF4982 domain-containing protein [Clostridia bacterium]
MRESRNMDLRWRFHLGDAPDAFYMGYDDQAWRPVTLPHDWAVEHPFDRTHSSGTGYLPGGIGWYRKAFTLSEEDARRLVRVTFQGVYKHARVWINSHYLGQHAYGYTPFSFDLTPFIRSGENLIAVRVEHTETADSRWYTGSGIDRHVLLTLTDRERLLEDQLFARTEDLSDGGALVRVCFAAENASSVRIRLMTPEGRTAGQATVRHPAGEAALSISDPHPWSPEDPFLYTLRAEALSGGKVADRVEFPFGLRTIRFDPDQGFFLNGRNMKLKGVCVHHDAGCLGAAVPKAVWRGRLEKLRAMGCNAIRTAHNPPDPDLLDLCDEMGFLVMDEAFDEWEGIKNKWWQGHNVYPPKHFGYGEDFPEWHERDLRAMVLRDRNHPSVILWSIGNEIDYPNDPYVTPLFTEVLGNNDANKPLAERLYDPRKPDASRLAAVAEKLVGIVHALDTSRPVTSALSFPELSNRTGFANVLDLSGYNYREQFYEEDHRQYPGRVILGSENSHDPAAWRAVEDRPYISGQFLWTGADFLGECPGWPKRISQAGALDLRGMEKPLYAQRQSLWTDTPVARIAVSSAAEEDRGAWGEAFRWEGRPGEEKRVACYTNQPEAELFLNGRSLGKKQVTRDGGFRAVWTVPYEEGALELRAGEAKDRLVSPGKAARILLRESAGKLQADGRSVLQLEITLLDSQGNPARDEIVHAQTVGDLALLGMENGRPDDLTPYPSPYRLTREGSVTVYLRGGEVPGKVSCHFRTQDSLTAVWKGNLTRPAR